MIPSGLARDRSLQRKIVDRYVDLGPELKGPEFQAIAEEFKIARRHVDYLLRAGIRRLQDENELLKVGPRKKRSEIEAELVKAFPHLHDVFVLEGGEIKEAFQYDALLSSWGEMAATYIDTLSLKAAVAGKELHICMSGGETILEIVNNLRLRPRGNVHFYASALIGRPHKSSSFHVDAIANATIAWARSGRLDGRCLYATVNPYDLTDGGTSYDQRKEVIAEQVDALKMVPSIEAYLKDDLAKVNVAISGLGTVIPPKDVSGLRRNRVTATHLLADIAKINDRDLHRDGAIGEMGYCYFDKEGKDDLGKWRFYLTAGDHDPERRGVKFYRSMVKRKERVIVCAGAFKEEALRAALKGKLFNVWFTNEQAARAILKPNPTVSPRQPR